MALISTSKNLIKMLCLFGGAVALFSSKLNDNPNTGEKPGHLKPVIFHSNICF